MITHFTCEEIFHESAKTATKKTSLCNTCSQFEANRSTIFELPVFMHPLMSVFAPLKPA